MQTKNLTKLSRKVLKALEESNDPKKPQDLVDDLNMNLRSIRYALKLLQEAELVDRRPDLTDLRTFYYYPSKIKS